MKQHYVRRLYPPGELRKARRDSLAAAIILAPATLLFNKAAYNAVANRLPIGSILICAPALQKPRLALEKAASYLRSNGHQVTTLPAASITA